MTGLVLLITIVVVSYLAEGWAGIGLTFFCLAAAFLLIWQTERLADRMEKGGGGRFGERIREERRRRDEKDGER